MLSFGLKILIKATHRSRSQESAFGKDSAVQYHIESFLQFVFAEFLLIAVWTWFKAPDDFFSIYNSLPITKFSIFQVVVANDGIESSGDGKGHTKRDSFTNGNMETGGDEMEDRDRHIRDSLLSQSQVDEDERRKSTLGKRSI